jgi:UPF0716 family protein affecting phage T7 exclusion
MLGPILGAAVVAGIMLFFVLAGAGNDRTLSNQSEKLAKKMGGYGPDEKPDDHLVNFAEWIVAGVIFIGLFVLVLSWD